MYQTAFFKHIKHICLNHILKTLCALSFSLSFTYAKDPSIPEVDENLIKNTLPNLIYGFECNQMQKVSHFDSSVLWVKDKDKVNVQNISNKFRYIRFAGEILNGGIWDAQAQAYVSANRQFMYFLKGSNLIVQSVCDKQQFFLSNYDKQSDNLHLKLRTKPTKEIAIVLNVANSMRDYVLAFKEIAPSLAKHIFKEGEDVYAKITLVSFSSNDIKDFDDVFNAQDFTKDVNTLQTTNTQSQMINYALIKAMSHFTKDNGLKKEIYLISDSGLNDAHNAQRMLKLTKNLNDNSVFNSKGTKENWVKIHTFSLKQNIAFLENLSKETEGNFYAPKSIYDFKKTLLNLSNDGKDVDPSEIHNAIIPSKTHKIYDPDNPDDNPPE
ncbi:hypothetical protein ACRE1U_03545 [Helicobacter himalayensis]|uniref:hypothetical protein n=1 Tax=Helicobacter himalayensis TaxID=1591088 RepID=UPI003D6FD171